MSGECHRNIELMWLTGRLAPDFKTIAEFRRNSGAAIRNACRSFVILCRNLKLFSQALFWQEHLGLSRRRWDIGTRTRRLGHVNHSPIPFLRKPGSLRAEGAHAGAAHDVLLLMEIDVSPSQAVLP